MRLTETPSPGGYVVPGLPGVYSSDWLTPVGLPGEATIEEARAATAGGAFEEPIVLELPAADEASVALRRRLEATCATANADPWLQLPEPDEAAICEEVARTARLKSRAGRGDWGGEVKLRRLLRDIRTFERQFDAAMSGREPLPAPRA